MKKLRFHLLLFAGMAGYLWLMVRLGIGCPIRHFTGLACPTCGATRSLFCLLRLDFAGYLHFHALSLPLVLVLLLLFHQKPLGLSRRLCTVLGTAAGLACFAYYAARLVAGGIP